MYVVWNNQCGMNSWRVYFVKKNIPLYALKLRLLAKKKNKSIRNEAIFVRFYLFSIIFCKLLYRRPGTSCEGDHWWENRFVIDKSILNLKTIKLYSAFFQRWNLAKTIPTDVNRWFFHCSTEFIEIWGKIIYNEGSRLEFQVPFEFKIYNLLISNENRYKMRAVIFWPRPSGDTNES